MQRSADGASGLSEASACNGGGHPQVQVGSGHRYPLRKRGAGAGVEVSNGRPSMVTTHICIAGVRERSHGWAH